MNRPPRISLRLKRFLFPERYANHRGRKKRLLFIRRTTAFGGSEVVILDLLKAIDSEKNEILLASYVDVFSTLLVDRGLPVKCIPITASFHGGFARVFLSWIRYLARLSPDKIILAEGSFYDFSLPIVLAAFFIAQGNVWRMALHPAPERPKRPYTLHLGLGLGLSDRARAWFAKGILAVSNGVKERLVHTYGYDPGKISVVYNGIDTIRFSPGSRNDRKALRTALDIPEEAVIVVSTARLVPVKCLDRLIRAFHFLASENRHLWLLLTGEGPLRGELETLAHSVDKGNKIKLLGHVPDVCPILQSSDIYVLPSDEEGFGLALVEAMACELVCVATKTVGPLEIIKDGWNGFLTDRTYDGVLEGLRQALRLGQQEREVMGSRARRTVIENFRVEESVTKGLAFMGISTVMETTP